MQHFKLRLFFFSFIICVLTLSSCTGGDEDINNDKLRNSDYVFYKEEGKPGYWQKISEDSDFNYTKGTLTYFFDNGNLFGEVEIVDDYSNRIVKFYDKKSDKLISTEWIEADSTVKVLRDNGYFERYYTNNGIVISEGKMQNNFEQGIWKIYNGKDGSLQEINEFKNGLVNGECKEFWKNGNLRIIDLDTLTLEGNGKELRYFSNGQLDCAFNFKNLKIEGQFIRYNENGTIIEESNRLGGISNGPFIIYYNNGQKEYEGNVILGRPNGEILYYHKDGTLDKSINFQNGIAQDSIIY